MPFEPTDYLPYDFANRRHIGPSPEEMAEMLDVVGASDLDALIDDTVPKSIRQKEPLDFGKAKSAPIPGVHESSIRRRLPRCYDVNLLAFSAGNLFCGEFRIFNANDCLLSMRASGQGQGKHS